MPWDPFHGFNVNFSVGFFRETSEEYRRKRWGFLEGGVVTFLPKTKVWATKNHPHDVKSIRWYTVACDFFGEDVPWFAMAMLVYRSEIPKIAPIMKRWYSA